MARPALDAAFKLPPMLGKLLKILIQHDVLRAKEIEEQLASSSPAAITVKRLREFMAEYNLEVNSRRQVGYWMTLEEKQRIVALAKTKLTRKDNADPHH